ncbi:MAG TPA: adenine-specific methyltransferase EcoRI family protein, partial [Nitrospiraceae bacterium]|nr:adenine-specific methyltransferase EcoRI family protein [Nitrospiraceae bacterium]
DYDIQTESRKKVEGGVKYFSMGSIMWFTNLDHGRRHQKLPLMTMAENLKFNRNLRGKAAYDRYDNYDAIEVGTYKEIPSDYDGVMGVPITFLDKYNPDQFEILGNDDLDYPATKTYGSKKKIIDGKASRSSTGALRCVLRADSFGPGTYFDVGYPVRGVYRRIFIRNRCAIEKKK